MDDKNDQSQSQYRRPDTLHLILLLTGLLTTAIIHGQLVPAGGKPFFFVLQIVLPGLALALWARRTGRRIMPWALLGFLGPIGSLVGLIIILVKGNGEVNPVDPEDSTKVSKPGFKLVIWACVALLFSMADSNMAFVVGFLATPAGIVIFIKRLAHSRLPALTCLACLILLVAGPGGCSYHTVQTKRGLYPIISALTEYKAKHGSYPKNLSLLQLKSEPFCHSPRQRVLYGVDGEDKDNEYHLTCYTFAFNKLTYSSKTRGWRNWD
jgi:hypothetical protein